VLFVIVGVREVTAEDFGSDIRDRLVVIRFPWYYATGFSLVSSALVGTALAHGHRQLSRPAWLLAMGLLSLALVGMIADYRAIYLPLERIVIPPGQPRTEQFMTLHHWSTRINSVNLLFCLSAAGLLTWPRPDGEARETASVP
jgi:hypothetical protein